MRGLAWPEPRPVKFWKNLISLKFYCTKSNEYFNFYLMKYEGQRREYIQANFGEHLFTIYGPLSRKSFRSYLPRHNHNYHIKM